MGLEEQLKAYADAYYAGAPLVSDDEYDQLLAQLQAQRPGYVPAVGGAAGKVPHVVPMLSLDKVTGPAEFARWRKNTKGPFVARPKFDGISISLQYAGGELVMASTRGDGFFGEDVTAHVWHVQGVPRTLTEQDAVEVRGEVALPSATHSPTTDFTTHPRNVAAGILARKVQPKEGLGPKDLHFYPFDVLHLESETDKIGWLNREGFQQGPAVLTDGTGDPDSWFPDRASWKFPADGVVIREVRASSAKTTAHHPLHSVAWKFAAQTSRSVVREVEWQTTRQGTVTPVAVFDTVQVDGALLSRATLHSLGRLETLGLCYADRIEISRRGGVIPHVERVLQASGLSTFAPPSNCSSCGFSLLRCPATNDKGEKADTLQCPNKGCKAQLEDAIRHWCASLDMLGFGPAVCAQLATKVVHPSGIYLLDWDDPWFPRTFGGVTAAKLRDELQRCSKRCKSSALLTAMGIQSLGKSTAKDLAARWSFEDLFDCTVAQLATVPGVGGITAQNIVAGLEAWAPFIALLAQGGHLHLPPLEAVAAAPKTGPLRGYTLCFTGTLSEPRTKMAALALEAGALVESSLTKAVNVLVVGADELADQQSSKFRKAVAQGVTIWDEDTFRATVSR